MIVLRKNDNIVIPNYDDLENKPKINGVTLEGSLTSEDLGITGGDADLSNYYTKIQSDNRFQLKGSYATIGQLNTVNDNINDKFDDYYDKSEIDEIIAGIEVSGSDIPYVVISNENNQLTSFGNLTDVINASINKTPYLAYLYNNNALPIGKGMYELQHVEYNETTGVGLFRVHIDKGAAHVNLDFNFEKNDNEFVLTTISEDVIHYAQQNYVDGAMNYITSNYATKSAVTTEIGSELSDYNDMIVNTYQPKGNYLTSVPSEYVTETELNNTLTNKNYATKSEIPTIPTNVSTFNNDAGYITENALNEYASENWVTENYQPKGDYLTSIPSEYITETELNDALAELDGNDIPYVVINGFSASGFSITHGNWADVYSAIFNKSPYVIYVRSTDQGTTFSIADDISFYSNGNPVYLAVALLQANRNVTYRAFSITSDGTVELSLQETYVIQQQLVSGENIKTINGESLFGSGNIEISGGTTDLSNYYTKTEIDTQIGDINTILENIIG